MRLSTEVWIQLESKGKPEATVTKKVTIREATLLIAKWLTETYMGSRIEIRIARRQEELKPSKAQVDTSMLADLENLLAEIDDNNDSEPLELTDEINKSAA